MTTEKGITVEYLGENRKHGDIFKVTGNGYNEEINYPSTENMEEQDVINVYLLN